MTVAYLKETAEQAGLDTDWISMEEIGWDRLSGRFVDNAAPLHPQLLQALPLGVAHHRPLRRPRPGHPRQRRRHGHHPVDRAGLEDAAQQQSAARDPLGAVPRPPEPPPRLSGRPARVGHRRGYVAKPLLGREGAGVTIHPPNPAAPPPPSREEPCCYQQLAPLPDFDGNHVVLGAWVVESESAGLGIRESSGLVTDEYARFLPHVSFEGAGGDHHRWRRTGACAARVRRSDERFLCATGSPRQTSSRVLCRRSMADAETLRLPTRPVG